eukprot:41594_1
MATLDDIKQAMLVNHRKCIHALETNYMNRIHQLLHMKTIILMELQNKFYHQLNEIDKIMKTRSKRIDTPVVLPIETNTIKPGTFVVDIAPLPPSINSNENMRHSIRSTHHTSVSSVQHNVDEDDEETEDEDIQSTHHKTHNTMREFKVGNPKFDAALSRLKSMRKAHSEGHLPSLRGFMKAVHLGFPKANAVLKYYAQKEMNMTLDAFKHQFMVLRQMKSTCGLQTDNGKLYECKYCKIRFESQSQYQKHVYCHIRDKPFECGYCKKRFVDQQAMKQHVQKRHIQLNVIHIK